MKIWLNGRMVDTQDAKVSIFDRGFLYGDGLFETMRAYGGLIFKMEDHLTRLKRSLGILRIRIPYSKEELGGAICRLLKINDFSDAYIRLTVTRGEGRLGIEVSDSFRPTVVIVAKQFEPYPSWMYNNGISAKVVPSPKLNEYSAASGVKSLNFLDYILARQVAKRLGFGEAILVNTKGFIAEASTSNVFLALGRKIITPSLDSGILPGITRKVVLALAKRSGLEAVEKKVSHSELLKANEVFLTNSLFEIIPVTMIDGKVIGDRRVGRVTRLLSAEYKSRVGKKAAK